MALPMKKEEARNPFDELARMQKEMDRIFSSMMERRPAWGDAFDWGMRVPVSDVMDRGDSFVIKAELPGMQKEDIKIECGDDSVSISAQRKSSEEEKKRNYYRMERTYSGYRRSFVLPQRVKPDSVDAEYKDGVLTVRLKKLKPSGKKMKSVRVK